MIGTIFTAFTSMVSIQFSRATNIYYCLNLIFSNVAHGVVSSLFFKDYINHRVIRMHMASIGESSHVTALSTFFNKNVGLCGNQIGVKIQGPIC